VTRDNLGRVNEAVNEEDGHAEGDSAFPGATQAVDYPLATIRQERCHSEGVSDNNNNNSHGY
jgi:hypothetical protein